MSFPENLETAFKALPADGLREFRQNAFDKCRAWGIPSLKNEEWKYTPVKNYLPETLRMPEWPGDHENITAPSEIIPSAIALYFFNGRFNAQQSGTAQNEGIQIGSIRQFYDQQPELFVKYFNKLSERSSDYFAALNTAFATDGLFIRISRKVSNNTPVFVHHIYDSKSAGIFNQNRNLIIVEEGANLNLIESFACICDAGIYNHTTEIFVGANAEVNYVLLQTENNNAISVNQIDATVERDGRYHGTAINFSGTLARNNLSAYLEGKNGEATINGLYLTNGKMHTDNHVLIDHRVPDCRSHQTFKGVLSDASSGVFNGKIFVQKDAQKTNAYQSSKAVLMSAEASINSKPQLEIYADDVKCSHGAAIGNISKNELFYLLARGIDPKTAQNILSYAFANEVVQAISIPELRTYLNGLLLKKLNLDL